MTPTETQIARARDIADRLTANSDQAVKAFAAHVAYDAALAAIMECEAWQDIESAPRDGTRVLVCWSDRGQICVAAWDDDYAKMDFAEGVGWRDDSDYGCDEMIGAMPTDWRPLPAPSIAAAIRAGVGE